MRILVLGAGVVGSVYAGKLLQAGHEVVMLAGGRRLADLQSHGLLLEDAESGNRTAQAVVSVSEPAPEDRFDLVVVPVRSEQLESTLAVLTAMTDGSDVLFFGNTGSRAAELAAALGQRAVFGFPAAGGTRDGPNIRYVLIRQQKTMLGESGGATTPRTADLQHVLEGAGFPTLVSSDIGGWLLGHAAFVVPIAFALYRVGIDAPTLAADPATMRLMVLATREGFTALHAAGNDQIPANLRALYRLPTVLVIAYWRRVLNGPRGELWFGAHSRAAPEEMYALARDLQRRCAIPDVPHPTSSGYWPLPREPVGHCSNVSPWRIDDRHGPVEGIGGSRLARRRCRSGQGVAARGFVAGLCSWSWGALRWGSRRWTSCLRRSISSVRARRPALVIRIQVRGRRPSYPFSIRT